MQMTSSVDPLKRAKVKTKKGKLPKKPKTDKFDEVVKFKNKSAKKRNKHTLNLHEISESDYVGNELENLESLKENEKLHNKPKVKNKNKKIKPSKKSKNLHNNHMDDEQEKTQIEDDGYRPGMITELLQIRKYGKVILPWDPSYGLDSTYKPPPWDGEGPKPIVNPLFDLSKRNIATHRIIDPSDLTVFVGNLNIETKVGDMKKLFRKCGKIVKVKLRKDGPHKSSGGEAPKQNNAATVRFETVEGCTAALKMNGKLYKDHHIRVTLQQDCSKVDTSRSVFVGNIAFGAGDDDLWKVFEKCGEIESVRIVRDKQTGKSRGFGYVNFKSEDSVEKAMELDSTTLLSHELRVKRNDNNVRSLSNTIKVKRKSKKKRTKLTASSKKETTEEEKIIQISMDNKRKNQDSPHSTKKIKKKKPNEFIVETQQNSDNEEADS